MQMKHRFAMMGDYEPPLASFKNIYGTVWYKLVQFGTMWYILVWYGLKNFGAGWYGIVLYFFHWFGVCCTV